MTYQCPKGHQSTDSDYCSECGALIGQSKLSMEEPAQDSALIKSASAGNSGQDICPDCGTPRASGARFCEVCRHDFQENKTGVAEAIVASQGTAKQQESIQPEKAAAVSDGAKAVDNNIPVSQPAVISEKDEAVVFEKLNVVISADADRAALTDIESAIKPDGKERIFPLDLDENLVGRRSSSRGIYPEIEINDPGVSHRHLKFIKQPDGSFTVLELGSANGTEINGVQLEAGINTPVKAGDELTIGIWTRLKIKSR